MAVVHVNRKKLFTFVALLVVVVAGAVWIALASTSTFTITGKLAVDSGCGTGGYSDLHDGTEVELVNSKNEVLRVTHLNVTGVCLFEFTLDEVPTGEDLYGVHIGNNNRGVTWKTEEEAREGYSLGIGTRP